MNKLPPTVLFTTLLSCSTVAWGQQFNGLNFDFTEHAFNAGAVSGSNGYNILNDTTGAKLSSDNGDADDIFISISSSVPNGISGAFADAEFLGGGGLKSNHGYAYTFANSYSTPTANNPGNLVQQTIRMTFASHISVTNFVTDFTSLNTAGRTWEHSELSYLKKDGSYFSAPTATGNYLSWQAANASQPSWNIGSEGPGSASGSPSQGWFLTASTATITDVGTDLSDAGSNGSRENFTGTNGNSVLDYNDVGLANGIEIGGFEWTVYVEDTRGQNNNHSSWTTTQRYIEISGEVETVPEPSSTLLIGLGSILLTLRRSRS